MLKSDDFPTEHLQALTEQIDNWLGDMIRSHRLRLDHMTTDGSPLDLGSFELGEQFLMSCLNDREIFAADSLDKDLGELVRSTRRRHHQIKYGKQAVAYARSRTDRDEALCQLFATTLAPKVQAAMAWIDAHEDSIPEFGQANWRVRLVTIPTFHTHAFLIEQVSNGSEAPTVESYIFVVSAPPWMEALPRQQFLRTREFLLAFQSKTPLIGVSGTDDVSENGESTTRTIKE